jgi:GH15 family glucan-1,4-alpha-glucosidase
MPLPIEDYAIVADCRSAALVGKDGSIDWLCLPRIDSDACFAALLGTPDHGRWLLAPEGGVRRVTRRYRDRTLILETEFETEDGTVTLVDLMPMSGQGTDVARIVVGKSGSVPMRMQLIIRFGYGSVVPWVRRMGEGIEAIGGPEVLRLATPVATRGEGLTTVAHFTVSAGDRVPFVLTWAPSHLPDPGRVDAEQALRETEQGWRDWCHMCCINGPDREIVERSLITLKALTYDPTGGIFAAATTSLPEQLGGVRNWDYRICWLRDATFTLYSLMSAGFVSEARAWRDWLLRAVAGDPGQIQILYGIAGERRLPEIELDWLPGYQGARPVRIGNAAARQLQLDVFGEVVDALHLSRRVGLAYEEASWALETRLIGHLEKIWIQPDEGIWEVRGARRHFTHSKVMAWVAFDRAVKSVEQFGLDGPVDRWRRAREEVHASVCREGFDPQQGSFVQAYGSKELDASLLLIPIVGFLPPSDPRVLGTVAAIEKRLVRSGFVDRYETETGVDGLPPGEGVFLPCSFWLADNYVLQGRRAEARALFDRLVGLCNDVGLLSEEYDPRAKRLVGNFPQAFSHVSLVNTALNLSRAEGPAQDRQKQ